MCDETFTEELESKEDKTKTNANPTSALSYQQSLHVDASLTSQPAARLSGFKLLFPALIDH